MSDFLTDLESYRQALNALLNAADYTAAGGDPSEAMPGELKLHFTKQLFQSKSALVSQVDTVATSVKLAGGDPRVIYELVEYTKNYCDRRFYEVLHKAIAEVKAAKSIVSLQRDPWLRIQDDYKAKYPKATAREVAGEIFSRMDGKEQRARLQEFAKTTNYCGKEYASAKDAAIAQIKKALERLK